MNQWTAARNVSTYTRQSPQTAQLQRGSFFICDHNVCGMTFGFFSTYVRINPKDMNLCKGHDSDAHSLMSAEPQRFPDQPLDSHSRAPEHAPR